MSDSKTADEQAWENAVKAMAEVLAEESVTERNRTENT